MMEILNTCKSFLGEASQLLENDVEASRHNNLALAAVTAGSRGDINLELELIEYQRQFFAIAKLIGREASALGFRGRTLDANETATAEFTEWLECNAERLSGRGDQRFKELDRLHKCRFMVV